MSPPQLVFGKVVRRLELISRLVTHVIQERDVNQLPERFKVRRAVSEAGLVRAESFTALRLMLLLKLSVTSPLHPVPAKVVNLLALKSRDVMVLKALSDVR